MSILQNRPRVRILDLVCNLKFEQEGQSLYSEHHCEYGSEADYREYKAKLIIEHEQAPKLIVEISGEQESTIWSGKIYYDQPDVDITIRVDRALWGDRLEKMKEFVQRYLNTYSDLHPSLIDIPNCEDWSSI